MQTLALTVLILTFGQHIKIIKTTRKLPVHTAEVIRKFLCGPFFFFMKEVFQCVKQAFAFNTKDFGQQQKQPDKGNGNNV